MLWELNFITNLGFEWLQSFERKVKNKNILWKREHFTIKNGTLPYKCLP
jgi:hypothetical protein